jgi:hypothetical protein
MKYLKFYDDQGDEFAQCVVTDGFAERARAAGVVEISDIPFEGLPVRPRQQSLRFPRH